MTDTYAPTCRVFDLGDPADLEALIKTPAFWTASGPTTLRLAIEYLKVHPSVRPASLPANVAAYLDRASN